MKRSKNGNNNKRDCRKKYNLNDENKISYKWVYDNIIISTEKD